MKGSGTNNSELVQMADILPPADAVPETSGAGLYLLLLLLLAAIVVFGLRYQNSSRRQLARLRKRYLQNKIDNRQCALELKRQLYADDSVSTVSARQRQQDRDWQKYSTALQAACYSNRGLDDDAMRKLLGDAELWL